MVFALALFARMALFYSFLSKNENYLVYFDSAQYQTVAQSLAQGKGCTTADGALNFYRLPGYPAFLAGCSKVFDNSIQATLLLQIIISCLIPLLMFCLTLVLFPQQFLLAKTVALIAVFHLGFVIYAGMLATESLFTIFFLFFLIFLSRKRYLGSGLMLGVASLIRPVGHFLLPVALVVIFLDKLFFKSKNYSLLNKNSNRDVIPATEPGSREIYKITNGSLIKSGMTSSYNDLLQKESVRLYRYQVFFKNVLVFTFGWLLIVIWWLGRNWLLTGMIFFHTLPGLHFLQYTTAKVVMELRNCSYVQARGALLDEWNVKIKDQEALLNRQLSEPEKCAIAEKITLFYCKKRPFTVIKNCACEMIKTVFGLYSAQLIFTDTQAWTDYSTSNIWSKLKKYFYPKVNTWFLIPLTWFEILYSFFLLIGFLGFCIRVLCNKQLMYQVLPILLFIFVLIGLTCAYGCARLRLPLEPLLVIESLHWWLYFYQKFHLHKDSYLVDTSCK